MDKQTGTREAPPSNCFFLGLCWAAHLAVSRRPLQSVFLSVFRFPTSSLTPVSQTESLSLTHTHMRTPSAILHVCCPSMGQGLAETLSVELSLVPREEPHQPPKHPGLGDAEEGGTSRGQGASLGAGMVL